MFRILSINTSMNPYELEPTRLNGTPYMMGVQSTQVELITRSSIEIIRAENGDMFFGGWASRFFDAADPGTVYQPLENVLETVAPDAFNDVIRSKQNVKLLFNHDQSWELGNTDEGSLYLSLDPKGLRYSLRYDPSHPQHVIVREKILRNHAKGSSFAAHVETVKTRKGDFWHSEIKKVTTLKDVSIVSEPAYRAASAVIRSAEFAALEKDYHSFADLDKQISEANRRIAYMNAKYKRPRPDIAQRIKGIRG